MTERLDVTETAAFVREALREAFPGTRFSVRSERYFGGSSIDVSWTDGPTEEQVDRTTDRFRGADFDGLTDLKTYRPAQEVDGRLVEFGGDFIFGHRAHSPELVARAVAVWEERHGATYDPDAPGNGEGHLTAREAVDAILRALPAGG